MLRRRLPIPLVVTAALLACFPLLAADKPVLSIRSAVVLEDHLLCLPAEGALAAWDMKTEKYAAEVAKTFDRKGLLRLGSNKKTLWAADETTLYQWAAKPNAWEKKGEFDADGESLVALVIVGETPVLVFPSKMIDPIGKRTFKAPKSELPLGGPPLRILATHGTETMLWIGTGKGEWGGELLGLDPKTEKWVTGKGSGYVTGMTHSVADEVVVSWSMSHFRAYTQVQIHNNDGTVKQEYPVYEGKYYQRLAYSPFDKTLYGIEASEVVTIEDGKPKKVVKLKGAVLEREPQAMGAAPGILELIPVGPKALVVVPKKGNPWLVRDGELIALESP